MPTQDLLVSCRDSTWYRLFRYDVARETWRQELPEGSNIYILMPLPGDKGVLLAAARPYTGAASMRLLRDGEVTALRGGERERFFFPLWFPAPRLRDPLGQHVPVRLAGEGGQRRELALLDVDSCRAGSCEWQQVQDVPHWSPDGKQMVLEDNGNILLGPRDGTWRRVGHGSTAFWVDATTYGYLSGDHLVLARVGEEKPRPLLPLADLYVQAGVAEGGVLESVLADPAGSGTLAIFIRGYWGQDSYIFLLKRKDGTSWLAKPPQPDEITILMRTAEPVFGPPLSSFSPDGRWLFVHLGGMQNGREVLYDLAQSGAEPGADLPTFTLANYVPAQNHDWSADGRWLARLADDYVELVAPAHGPYRRFLAPPSHYRGARHCSSLAWVNPD